jgi:hypothetical protein
MHEGCLPSWPIVASSFRFVVDHPPLVSRTSLLNTTQPHATTYLFPHDRETRSYELERLTPRAAVTTSFGCPTSYINPQGTDFSPPLACNIFLQ